MASALMLAGLVAACGDSDKPSGDPVAGAGNQAGSMAVSGAGASGSGGTAAIVGAGNGGAGGAAAGSGDAGSGGAGGAAAGSGGAGGAAAGDGGSGGAGGTAGSGGTGSTLDAGMDARTSCTGELNVLFMLDESGSMQEVWVNESKSDGVRAVVTDVVTTRASALTVGTLFFPTAQCVPFLPSPPGGAVLPLSDPMQIDFRSGSEFLSAWQAHIAAVPTVTLIGTPLDEAFDRVAVALSEASLSGTTRVILITDGAGNCVASEDAGIPIDTPVNHVAAWASRGIETYVISLAPDTTIDAGLTTSLEAVAASAGTPLIEPLDPAALDSALDDLLSPPACP